MESKKENVNRITLLGVVSSPVEFSHETKCEKFYKFYLSVKRKSGCEDVIMCIVPEVFLKYVEAGKCVGINGEIRTRNNHSEGKSKLEIYVFVLGVDDYEGQNSNYAELEGYVCKEPTYRETPSGRGISDLMIASKRYCGKSDYIPCICWGSNALYASDFPVGAKVRLSGRLQSREYIKRHDDGSEETKTAYELSVGTFEVSANED